MLLHGPLIAWAWDLITLGWGRRQPTGEGSDASKESAATTLVLGNQRTELHHPRRIARYAATQGQNAVVSLGVRRVALLECQPTAAATLAREIARESLSVDMGDDAAGARDRA